MARLEATLVLVVWHDAHAETSWTTLDDIDVEPYVVESVGWLLPNVKPGHLVLAQSIGSDSGLDAVLQIPVGMVQKTTVLGYPHQANTGSLP